MLEHNKRYFKCGEFINESEKKANEALLNYLNNIDNKSWILLSNLSVSANRLTYLPLEIDELIIHSKGVKIIEIKHWDKSYIDNQRNFPIVEHESLVLKKKVQRILGKIQQILGKEIISSLNLVGCFLLTRNPKEKYIDAGGRKKLFGFEVFGLSELDYLMTPYKDGISLKDDFLYQICKNIIPQTDLLINSKLHEFEKFTDLNLIKSLSSNFHRVFSAKSKLTGDKVILHLYDLTALEGKSVFEIAHREFLTLQKLQKCPYVPSIMDSFQEAKSYPGEIYYFTYINPEAVSLQQRSKDKKWTVSERIFSFLKSIEALKFIHSQEEKIIVRYLNPTSIRIKSNNEPIFTQLHLSKISGFETISEDLINATEYEKNYFPPEVIKLGFQIANENSDIYSLCKSFETVFADYSNENIYAAEALKILEQGCNEKQENRISLNLLSTSLQKLFEKSLNDEKQDFKKLLDPIFWDENTIKELNQKYYRIVERLGSGSVGATFKVVEVDEQGINELSGPYVAKVITNSSVCHEATKAYSKVRAQTGGKGLAGVLEVRKEWQKNEITALLKWVEGDPLSDWKGILPLYIDELKECTHEEMLLRWMRDICEGLSQLHQVGMVHGDVSPKNIILKDTFVTLTDFDLSIPSGSQPKGGTPNYCSINVDQRKVITFSDDIYSLAATFFDVYFDRYPFVYEGILKKDKGINWEEIDQTKFKKLAPILNKATHPDSSYRYQTAMELKDVIDSLLDKPKIDDLFDLEDLNKSQLLTNNEVPWLMNLLQSYPGSPKGNIETRGLDSPFAQNTYVETELDHIVKQGILEGKYQLIILCGNAGDGKTAFLQNLAKNLGMDYKLSSVRLWEDDLSNGLRIKINFDGAASYGEKSSQEILDEFFYPFQNQNFPEKLVHLIAINNGPLLAWIENQEENWLTEQLYKLLNHSEDNIDSRICFIDLNERSLVGGYNPKSRTIETEFLDKIIDKLKGSQEVWKPCKSCTAKNRCSVAYSVDILSDPQKSSRLKERLYKAFQAVHQRGEIHITARLLRGTLAYIFFGTHYCTDLHENVDLLTNYYWDRVFDPSSEYRQGDLLRELQIYDPAIESHPRIDKELIINGFEDNFHKAKGQNNLASLRRRAYFEWSENKIIEIGGSPIAID